MKRYYKINLNMVIYKKKLDDDKKLYLNDRINFSNKILLINM